MRKVIIDGVEYPTIRSARRATGLSEDRIRRMAASGKIQMSEHRRHMVALKTGGGRPHPVWCRSVEKTFLATSMREAIRLTGCWCVAHIIGTDEDWHGWTFQPAEQDEALSFDTPVPDGIMQTIYSHARKWFAFHYNGIPYEDRRDLIQQVVAKTASDWSQGKYERYASKYELDTWLYLRVRHHGSKVLKRWKKKMGRYVEPDDDLDKDEWLEREHGGVEQADDSLPEGMPEEYDNVARLLLEGRSRVEIMEMLGLGDRQLRSLTRRLGEWLKGNTGDEK